MALPLRRLLFLFLLLLLWSLDLSAVAGSDACDADNGSWAGWTPFLVFRIVQFGGGIFRPGVKSGLTVRGMRKDGVEREGLGAGNDIQSMSTRF